MTAIENPLIGAAPMEVPLSNAPLVQVIAQVRFPLIASLGNRDFIAPIQEAIRSEYPILRPDQSQSVIFGEKGPLDARTNTAWRFHDANGEWRVTLASDFLALQTSRYSSRDDFLDRFRRVLESFVDHVDPGVMDRLGVRYVDRITGENLKDLPALVRPEVSGVLSTPLASQALHSISQTVFTLPDDPGQVMTRWGRIPAGGTVDPGAVDPIDESSWMLDIDAYDAVTRKFDVASILKQAQVFSERIYNIFRWAVTDEFLRRYGGKP